MVRVPASGSRGRPEVLMQDGCRLCVVPEPESAYESWNLKGPDGLRIVSVPGGELDVWDSRKWIP
ncbi:DUF6188 family protein [Paenarthrobacter ureafaciens]|uniref:DUF6188 family protein n=1 Tax=Paenarthrobacter ureafaciens TaxID=37931 RepID=UPI00398AE3C4